MHFKCKAYDLIVDVREPGEYEDGYVPGAINIPRGLLEFLIWKKVGFPDNTDTGKKIYIYCRTGGRAALATKSLQDLGFINVVHVNMKTAE
jgi:rhodanese-related sulfurtransferase